MKNETKKETKLYEITARLDVEIHEEIFAVSEEDAKKQMREYFHNRMIFDEPSESFAKYLVDENIRVRYIEIDNIDIDHEMMVCPHWCADYLGRQESARVSRKDYDFRQQCELSDDGVLTND